MMFKDRRDAGRKLHPGAGTSSRRPIKIGGPGTFKPTSFRRMRSASLMTPITRPASSTTGSALISLSTGGFATSDIEACGWVVITFRTMTSEAFIRRFSLTIENLYKPKSLPTPRPLDFALIEGRARPIKLIRSLCATTMTPCRRFRRCVSAPGRQSCVRAPRCRRRSVFRGNLEFRLCCGADTTSAVEDPFGLVGPTMRGPARRATRASDEK